MSSTPPPVPEKDDINTIDNTAVVEDTPPELPPRETVPELPAKPDLPPRRSTPVYSYNIDDSVSLISTIRQLALYSTPIMFESSDLFSNSSTNIDNLREKISIITLDDNDNDKYWYKIVSQEIYPIEDKNVTALEGHILQVIPDYLRTLIYFKILQVRYVLNDNFDELLKKAKCSVTNSYIENLLVSTNLQDVLRVFDYYSRQSKFDKSALESYDSTSVHFIANICKILGHFNLSQEELLFLLLKFNKLFHNLIKNELFYKINRSLEDLQKDIFVHITKQGIQLNQFYKHVIYNFFDCITNQVVLVKILDLFIFEGFDFMLRLIIWSFEQNKAEILAKNNNELQQFILSPEFFNLELNFEEILQLNPEIIKYENEFHLIYANSLSNNNNELSNLREANEDLTVKIKELEHDLTNLETTHQEIIQQSDEFHGQLTAANTKNEELISLRDQLKQRFEQVSMKENLTNTIKANKEFAERNQELETQIEALKASISEKSAKIQRVA